MTKYQEGTILFDIENKETFTFDEKRDGFVVGYCPERFRVATPEDIEKHPITN